MAKQVLCRPFRNDDLEGVLDLTYRVLDPAKRSREERRRLWVWKYDKNPYHSPDVPRGFVLEHEGRVGGYSGQFAIPMKLAERVTIAYAGHDFCVDEDLRGNGLKLARAFANNAGVPEREPLFLFATSANEVSCRILLRLKFTPLERGKNFWSRIRHSRKILRAFVGQRPTLPWRLFNNETVLSAASIPLDLFFRAVRLPNPSGERLKTKAVERFDDEFDRLWCDVSSHYGFLVVRDSKYLNWRYADYPLQRPQALSAYDSGGNLRGFVVVRVTSSAERGVRTAVILELFTRPGDAAAQQELLRAALGYAGEQDVDEVRAGYFPSEIGRLLKKNLFFQKQKGHTAWLFKYDGVLPDNSVKNEENWFVSLGDGDASF